MAPADIVLRNGKVITIDAASRVVEAIAIHGDRIVAVGRNEAMAAHTGPATCVIDLKGKAVIPGITDGHAHMDREGLRYEYPSLAGAKTKAAILAIVEREVAKAQPGEWVVTMPLGDPPFHFDARQILADTGLTRYDLDTVSPNNPVYIRSIWGFWDGPPLVANPE